YNGTSWGTQTSNTGQNLNDVYAVDSSHVWAVGATGTIDFYNGTSWATQTSGITTALNGVFFLDASNGWAVGDSGKVLKTTNGGTNWSTVSVSGVGSNNLRDIV